MIQHIITDLCHHLEIGIDGNLDIGNKRIIVGTPTITLIGNTFTISCSTSNVNIYYTLDGSTPTANSIRYTSAVTLSNNCTIKVIAIKGNKYSAIVEETYVKPITYLTQWKIVGNSEVHTDEYLTSWKVSGNSVVDNNTILSCGDLGQDGKYHVKISNGVTIFDIPLTEPLRKVNDISDTIEFANGVVTLTRNLAKFTDLGKKDWGAGKVQNGDDYYMVVSANVLNPAIKIVGSGEATALCSLYNIIRAYEAHSGTKEGIGISSSLIRVYDKNYNQQSSVTAFKQHIKDIELIYWIEPITEVIEVSPFSVSSTDTYTSANVIPYSEFEYKKNVEIWSCGEYSAVDGKYHILVQPLGGGIADIALTEPLRKVNNVADTIEFPSNTEGKALVTRNLKQIIMSSLEWNQNVTGVSDSYRYLAEVPDAYPYAANVVLRAINTGGYINDKGDRTWVPSLDKMIGSYPTFKPSSYPHFVIFDSNYDKKRDLSAFLTYIADKLIIYRLATPTTELIDVPQIAEADSYSCVISQGAKAVSWSSFETE